MTRPRHASYKLGDSRVKQLLAEDPDALVTDLRPSREETDRVVREADERSDWWLRDLVRR